MFLVYARSGPGSLPRVCQLSWNCDPGCGGTPESRTSAAPSHLSPAPKACLLACWFLFAGKGNRRWWYLWRVIKSGGGLDIHERKRSLALEPRHSQAQKWEGDLEISSEAGAAGVLREAALLRSVHKALESDVLFYFLSSMLTQSTTLAGFSTSLFLIFLGSGNADSCFLRILS